MANRRNLSAPSPGGAVCRRTEGAGVRFGRLLCTPHLPGPFVLCKKAAAPQHRGVRVVDAAHEVDEFQLRQLRKPLLRLRPHQRGERARRTHSRIRLLTARLLGRLLRGCREQGRDATRLGGAERLSIDVVYHNEQVAPACRRKTKRAVAVSANPQHARATRMQRRGKGERFAFVELGLDPLKRAVDAPRAADAVASARSIHERDIVREGLRIRKRIPGGQARQRTPSCQDARTAAVRRDRTRGIIRGDDGARQDRRVQDALDGDPAEVSVEHNDGVVRGCARTRHTNTSPKRDSGRCAPGRDG